MRSSTLLGLLLAFSFLHLDAQTGISVWTGEWGSFLPGFRGPLPQPEGHGLTLSGCSSQRCELSVLVQDDAGHGSATGFADLVSATEAVAHLTEGKQEYCTLRLTLDPQQPSIAMRAGTGDCSYFLTPGATFVHNYSLHTRNIFVADDVASCFTATTPAPLALCTDKDLAKQRSQWQLLFLQVEDLVPSTEAPEMERARSAETAITTECNSAAQVQACLGSAFARHSATLQARRSAWLDEVTAPGNSGDAHKLVEALQGSYRHSFPNGDVQGDHFLSSNTLTLDPGPDNSLHYDAHLEFFNGHECSIRGTALFRRGGFFVDQQKTGQPNFPLCVFEIKPSSNGVQLLDPTGACKMSTCGMRGGYNGAEFSFKDRQ